MPIVHIANGELGDIIRGKVNAVIDIANGAVQVGDPIEKLIESTNFKILTAAERTKLATVLLAADIGTTVAPFIKHNYNGSRAPLPTDDVSEGYTAGSTWTHGLTTYKCFDPTDGAAIWGLTSLTSEDLGDAAFTSASDYALAAQGVTNGNSHNHEGGDGGQIAYTSLVGIPVLGTAAATASSDYAPATKGVTNGDLHNHHDGDGAQIDYATLSGLPTLGTAAATDSNAYAPADQGVANGNTHNHEGGDGGQIAYSSLSGLPSLVTGGNAHNHDGGDGAQIAYASLSGLPTLGTAAATASTAYAPAAQGVTNGNAHDHNGGDGAQIAYSSLSGLPVFGSSAWTPVSNYAPSSMGVTGGNLHDHNGGDGGTIAYTSLSGRPTLGTAAAKDTGTGATQVATGDHLHSTIYQPLDADLTALSGLNDTGLIERTETGIGDNIPTYSIIAITSVGKELLAALTTLQQRAVLGLGTAATTSSNAYAVAAKGVTNGDTHAHVGGAGGTIAYANLSGKPTLPVGVIVGTTDTQTLSAKTLVNPVITGSIRQETKVITDGPAFEIDPANGSMQRITLGANRTPKATNFQAGHQVLLFVADGAAYTISWTDTTFGPNGVIWIEGSAPTLNTSGYTIINLVKFASQVYGSGGISAVSGSAPG